MAIPVCLIDSGAARRQRIARSIAAAGYEVQELNDLEDFLNCDLKFSILILVPDGSVWNDARMLFAAASVPVIVLAPEGQWARLACAPELKMERNPISVSHMNVDEIIWRIEALLLRTVQRAQPEAKVQQFAWGDHRFINGAHCVDLVSAYN